MPRLPRPLADRFWEKVEKTDGCWFWRGTKSWGASRQDYGVIGLGRKGEGQDYAHRVAYALAKGPIPDGYYIDHLCRNTLCVRPDHLEAVTPRENVLRGDTIAARHAARTHCPQGHPYEPPHLWVDKHGYRHCRTCTTKRSAERRRRLREQAREELQ